MSASASSGEEDFPESIYISSQYEISTQNDILKKRLEDLNKRYTNLQTSHESEMMRLENSIQNLHKKHTEQLNVLNSTIKSLQETLDNVRNESSNQFFSRSNNSQQIPQNNIFLTRLQSLEFENQRLQIQLENQIEFNNILQNKIEKMPEYENTIKYLNSNPISETEKQINESNKKKLFQMKNEINEKNKIIANLRSAIDEMKSTVDSTKTELNYKNMQISKLEKEIAKKKEDQNQHENLISQINKNQTENIEKVQHTFDIFEEFIQNKDQQILELTNQRNSLINIIKKFENAQSISEETLNRATVDNEKLEMQLDELQLSYNQSLDEAREVVNQLFEDLSNTYDYQFNPNKTPYENIISLIERISGQSNLIEKSKDDFEPLIEIQNENYSQSNSMTEELINKETERRMAVLGQFENAIRFLHSLANSSNKVVSQFDFQDRTLILTQCVRMSKFIEDEAGTVNLPSISSLFDPLSVESNAKLFYKFVDESEDAIKQSPIRELYVMFLATLEVNFLLFNKNNELISIQNSLSENQQKIEEQQRSKEDSYQEIYYGQCKKLKEIAKVAIPYTNIEDGESDPFEVLLSLIEAHKKLIKTNKNNQQSIKKLKSVIFSMTSNMLSNSQNNTEIKDSPREMSNESQSRNKSEIKLLYRHIKKLKSENEALKNDIQKVSSEKEQIILDSKSEIDELNQNLNESRESYEKLYSKYNQIEIENRSFEDEMVKLTQKVKEMEDQSNNLRKEKEEIQKQIQKQKESDRKTKEKNKILTKRISELENSGKSRDIPISDFSQQTNEEVENLNNQIKEKEDENSHLQTELSATKNEKMVLQMTIKKLMLQNKRNQCLIDQINSQIQQRENQVKLKCDAQIYQSKIENEKTIKELQETITNGTNKLHNLLKDKFDNEVPEDNATIPNLVSILYRLINEKHVTEINALNLDNKTSAIDLIKQLRNETEINRKVIDQIGQKNDQLKTQIKDLSKKTSKLSEAKADSAAWISWARSIYRLVSEGQIAPNSIPDLRCALEESMLTSIGHRKMRRKLEILRSEKKALISPSVRLALNSMTESKNRKNQSNLPQIPSIRPFMLIFMFMRRLQQYGGCLPSAYKCGDDTPMDDSTLDDSV